MSEKTETGIDPLAVQVQRQRDEIHIAGPLAVSEQRPLDALGAGHQRQLRRGDRGAAIVVRVHAQHHRVTGGEVAVHPLDQVGVEIRSGQFDGRRKVDDRLAIGRWLPHVDHRVTHLDGVVDFGSGEALRRVLKHPFRPGAP